MESRRTGNVTSRANFSRQILGKTPKIPHERDALSCLSPLDASRHILTPRQFLSISRIHKPGKRARSRFRNIRSLCIAYREPTEAVCHGSGNVGECRAGRSGGRRARTGPSGLSPGSGSVLGRAPGEPWGRHLVAKSSISCPWLTIHSRQPSRHQRLTLVRRTKMNMLLWRRRIGCRPQDHD